MRNFTTVQSVSIYFSFRLLMRIGILGLLASLLWACQPPNAQQQGGQPGLAPKSEQDEFTQQVVEGATDVATEFKELSKPNRVQVWVDALLVKAQPGKDMPKLATLHDGDKVEYLYQRTIRKSEATLGGQRYYQPWILIKLADGTMGWVHEGGVRYLEPEANPLRDANQSKKTAIQDGIPENNDWRIVPGRRVGSISIRTTEADLVRMFGLESVARGKVSTSASKQEDCTILLPGRDEELRIVWKDADHTRIKAVYVLKPGSQWQLTDGIRVGTSLADLTKLNEAPVSFYGFQWEYSGTISSYRNGRLAKFEKGFYMALAPSRNTSSSLTNQYRGDKVFSSNAEGVDAMSLFVEKIVVYLD